MGRTLAKVIIDEWRKAVNIFSTYNLCSTIPFEELTAQPTSAYFLCIAQKEYLTVSPTSVYTLAVA